MSASASKTRILVLHGFYDSAENRQNQMRSLIRTAKDVEFVFLNAPFPFIDYGFLQSVTNAPTEQRYQWMSYKPEWSKIDFPYDTIAESVQYIIDYINANGPFDGLLGFSQGAVVCLIMLMKIPTWLIIPHCIKFVILVGCPPIKDPKIKPYVETLHRQDQLPTLHVSGSNDSLITPQMSEMVFRSFDPSSAEFYLHKGGHYCPNDSDFRQKLREFIQRVNS